MTAKEFLKDKYKMTDNEFEDSLSNEDFNDMFVNLENYGKIKYTEAINIAIKMEQEGLFSNYTPQI